MYKYLEFALKNRVGSTPKCLISLYKLMIAFSVINFDLPTRVYKFNIDINI